MAPANANGVKMPKAILGLCMSTTFILLAIHLFRHFAA